MPKDFLAEPKETPSAHTSNPPPTPSDPEREPVQILVIGSSKGINKIVHSLYSHGFAQVGEWSLLMPAPIPGKLMRALIRNVFID